MVQFHTQSNEILVKIVYYGPGLSGKTTNLKSLHRLIRKNSRSELFSVDTMEDRTLFFDLLPVQLPAAGRTLKFQVYTVPGQVHYDSTRRIILSGADGVVFVADSAKGRIPDNIESLNNLHKNLNANRLNIKTIPLVLQFNKQDLSEKESLAELNRKLNFRDCPSFPASALQGEGVLETFRQISLNVAAHVVTQYHLSKDPMHLEQLRSDISSYLDNLADLPEQMEPDHTDTEPSDNKDRDHTKLSYLSEDNGPVENEAILEKALQSTQDTARLLQEVQVLKQELEEKNRHMKRLLKENQYIRQFLESLFHHAGLPIFTFNHIGKVSNWNKACVQLFGHTVEEAKGMHFSDLIPETSLLDVQTLLSIVNQKHQTQKMKVTLLSKEGQDVPVTLTLSPILDSKNHVSAVAAILV